MIIQGSKSWSWVILFYGTSFRLPYLRRFFLRLDLDTIAKSGIDMRVKWLRNIRDNDTIRITQVAEMAKLEKVIVCFVCWNHVFGFT